MTLHLFLSTVSQHFKFWDQALKRGGRKFSCWFAWSSFHHFIFERWCEDHMYQPWDLLTQALNLIVKVHWKFHHTLQALEQKSTEEGEASHGRGRKKTAEELKSIQLLCCLCLYPPLITSSPMLPFTVHMRGKWVIIFERDTPKEWEKVYIGAVE